MSFVFRVEMFFFFSVFNDGNISKEDIFVVLNMGVYDSFYNKSDIQSDIFSDQNGFFVLFGDNFSKVKFKFFSVIF